MPRQKLDSEEKVVGDVVSGIKEMSKTVGKPRVEFLDSGATALNMALSGKGRGGGWARGRVVNIIGDGSSGKTLLAIELAFNAFKNMDWNPKTFPRTKKLYIVYNNVEGVMDFPLEKMYGEDFVKSVEWIQIPTIEGFGRDYTRRVSRLKDGEALIYIVDSLDALVSEISAENFLEAAEKDEAEKGSYGMEKQKYGGKFFGQLCSVGQNKDATLVVISQVRENINVMFGKKYRRAGGKSLDFYTHQCLWLAVKSHLKKTVQGETRDYGVIVKAKLERSKVGLPFREVEFVVLFNYGLDRYMTDIHYVFGENSKGKIMKFDKKDFTSVETLAQYIVKHDLTGVLTDMVEAKWNSIENSLRVDRPSKF